MILSSAKNGAGFLIMFAGEEFRNVWRKYKKLYL
jgi:hypothetical protein